MAAAETESNTSDNCVLLEGELKDIQLHKFGLYFENKSKSRGGRLRKKPVILKYGILVEFESSEAAQDVIEKGHHTVGKNEYKAVKYQKIPHYMNKILVKNIPEKADTDDLQNYLEALLLDQQVEVETIRYCEDPREAVVFFKDNIDIPKLKDLSIKKTFLGTTIIIQSIEMSKAVKLVGVNPETSDETLKLYFQNTKRSGGGKVRNIERLNDGILICFADYEVVDRVCWHTHCINGQTLKAKLYLDCLRIDGGSTNPNSCTVISKTRMSLVTADIACEKTEAVVNSTNGQLDLSQGAIAGALRKRGGDDLQADCNKKYPKGIQLGEIAKTKAFNMKFTKYIYHCNLPKYQEDTSMNVLKKSILKCLQQAEKDGIISIAFPAIGAGILKYPREKVANNLFEIVHEYGENNPTTTLTDVVFVMYKDDQNVIQVFKETQEKYKKKYGTDRLKIAADRVDEVNIKLTGDKTERRATERDLERTAMIARQRPKIETKLLMSERETKDKSPSGKVPEVVNISGTISEVKVEAGPVIHTQHITSTFNDMPLSKEVVSPVINRASTHIKDCNQLKKDLLDASGVISISNNELAKTMSQNKYSEKCNKNPEPQRAQVEPYSVKAYTFRALEYLFGKDKLKKICRDIKEADGETHFTLPKHPKDRDLVEDLEDLMNRRIRHEEIDVTDDKIEEAKLYSRKHAHMDTVYVEVNTKASSIHILGEDYVEVELVSHQAKLAVGIMKLTNKKQQRTRTDEYTPTPTVKLPPAEIQERIFHTKCKNLKVHVKKSDITILDVDVIVNAANGMMIHGGGVARFIAVAGGDELVRQCRRYIDDNGQLPVTGICKTTGGNMRCKQVYHAVGPCWSDYSNKSDCEDDLCKTIVRCLVEADQDGFQSIAIPSISSAIFGVPKNVCAHMYAKAVKSFDVVYSVSSLREIYFVDVIDGMVSMVQTGFDMFFTQGDDDDLIKEEIERFIKEITLQQSEEQTTDKNAPEFSMIAVTKEVDNKPYIACTLQSIITLHVYQAAVLSTKTDSITTWDDVSMTDFKASAKKIIYEAGDRYKEQRAKVKSEGDFKAGSVLRSSAGCLQYQNIYHLISTIKPGRIELGVLLDNLVKEISMTTDASITIDIGDVDADLLFTSLVNLFKTAKSSTLKEIHLVAESDDKIKKLQSNYGDYIKQLGGIVKTSDTNCSICSDEITDITALPCGHTFCAECVDGAIEKNPVCPTCRSNVYGEIQTGNQPDGKIEHSILHTHLAGFPHRDTIEIVYTFPDGIQSAKHPRPGYPFKGKTETAYLPDNKDGREILKLLKLAFDRRLIFTVSPGVTSSSGREFVTWNNIPHKTRKDGGPKSNGYPDPDYLTRVRRALYTRGVVIEGRDVTGQVYLLEEYLAQYRQMGKQERIILPPNNPICKDGNELIEELQTYQNTELTVKADTKFSHDDLRSLNYDNWLYDTIIDTYLSLLSEDEKQHGNSIYVIPTYIAALMLKKNYGQCMSALENVKLGEYTWVFMPVHTPGHWVLLVANIKQHTVSLLDSLQDGNTNVVVMWNKFMKFRAEATDELNFDWIECNDWVSGKQDDVASCGPFVLLNALAISRNIKPQCFNNEHAKLMRKLVYHRITSSENQVAANSGIKENGR